MSEMPENNPTPQREPNLKWFPIAALCCGTVTLFYFMALGWRSEPVPCDKRFVHVIVLSLGVALSSAFIGGSAIAKGLLPFPKHDSLKYSVRGGLAILLILLVTGYFGYAKSPCEDRSLVEACKAITLPYKSGWIFYGYLDKHSHKSNGISYARVFKKGDANTSKVVQVGDIIELTDDSGVYIKNFIASKAESLLVSPIDTLEQRDPDDFTGVTLPAGCRYLVLTVDTGSDAQRASYAVWTRVSQTNH